MTEVIDHSYPRAKTPEMKEAIMNEVRDLSKQGTFKVLLSEELSDGPNALCCFRISFFLNQQQKVESLLGVCLCFVTTSILYYSIKNSAGVFMKCN